MRLATIQPRAALRALLLCTLAGGAPAYALPGPQADSAQAGGRQSDSAEPDAKTLWKRVLAATYGTELPKDVSAFAFDVKFLRRGNAGSNEERLTLRFLAPHFVHMRMRSGREQGRGPKSNGGVRNWFRQSSKEEPVNLVGRDYSNDRKELDRLVALSRNFLALANPANLKTKGLRKSRPPGGLPREGKVMARKLNWLEFESTDFQLPGGTRESATYNVRLGVDGNTGEVKRALIQEAHAEEGDRVASPLLLAFDQHREVSGVRIPQAILVYEAAALDRFGPDFEDKASVEIYVEKGNLRPKLSESDFLP